MIIFGGQQAQRSHADRGYTGHRTNYNTVCYSSTFPLMCGLYGKTPKTGASSLPEFHIASQKVPVLSRRIFSTSLWGCVSPPSLDHPLRVCLCLTASLDTICPATYISP